MKAVVGLGNPGSEYVGTRHNLGYRVVEEMARRGRKAFSQRQFGSMTARIKAGGGKKIILAKPITFMNRSGRAVRDLSDEGHVDAEDILVVCDDLNLPLGQLRIRGKGSDGGHNGLRSVINALGHVDFPRLRIGIGPGPSSGQPKFVLSEFRAVERPTIEEAIMRAADATESWINAGLAEAMNRFNQSVDEACPAGDNGASNTKGE